MFNAGLLVLILGLSLGGFWPGVGLSVALAGLLVWAWAVLRFIWDRWRGVPHPSAAPLGGLARTRAGGVALEPDRPVALDDPEIPPSIRAMVQAAAEPGSTLWRCVRKGGASGPLVLEWWLLDAEGELVDAYWP